MLRMKSVLVLNLGALLLVGWGFAGEYMRSRGLQEEIDRLESQAEELEARNIEMARMADRFSGSAMLEREARLKLNLKRPGEEVVVIRETGPQDFESEPVEDEMDTATPASGSRATENVRKWINYLTNRD